MTETLEKVNYLEKKEKGPIIPIIFLILVLFLSFGIFGYNKYLENQNNKLNTEIEKISQNIDEKKKDKSIIIYNLLQTNKKAISELEKRSKISYYMRHLDTLSKSNNIDIYGFSLKDGKISTVSFLSGDSVNSSHDKLTKFIKNYREDKKSPLELGFVNLVEGMDSMKFNLNFYIK